MARILVIDDDKPIRDLLRKTLEMAGHETEEAYDGQHGLELNRSNPVDLVITDIFMPRKGGLEVIEEIRREYPRIKIISITAGEGDDCAEAKELGAVRTFVKPIKLDELLDAVKEVLHLSV